MRMLETNTSIVVQCIELLGNKGGTGWRSLNIRGLKICGGPQVEACEYVEAPLLPDG